MGPMVMKAWGEFPGYAIALLFSFYLTMIGISLLIIIIMGTTEFLDQRGRKILIIISGVILAGLGIYYLISGGITLFS